MQGKPFPKTLPFHPAGIRRGLAAFILSVGTIAPAHQDPVGDVHPEVSVVNGHFSVTFSNNERMAVDRDSFRVIHAADGTLVVPRHRISSEAPRFGAAWEGGSQRAEGGRIYEMESDGRVLTIRSADGSTERFVVPWPGDEPTLELFEDFAVLGGRVYLLGTLPHPEGPYQGSILTLHRFDPALADPPLKLTLGTVATIYHFPTTSPLVITGGRLVLAWMGRPEEVADHQFCLTTVDPATMEPTTRPLAGDYHWNTHVSMAAIGTRLCVAWHDGEIYGPFRKAKIRVLFEDLGAE